MTGPRKKRRKRRSRSIDPKKLQQLRQKRKIRSLFGRIGFAHIASDGIEFTFQDRTGELDDIFVYKNVVIVCEYTVGKAANEHVSKKAVLYSKILSNQAEWVASYARTNSEFATFIADSQFSRAEFRVRIVYVSSGGVSEEIESAFENLRFLDGTRLRYFESLSHTIHRSARHEFFKYVNLEYTEIGSQVHKTQATSVSFHGHLLPEGHSSYPSGFKVVSFYADPESLLALSYVLRQDSWRDGDGLYQRILIKSKISRMRKYLVEVERVFVNNIIVTLPASTTLNCPDQSGKNVDAATLDRATHVSISVPYGANMIGLVDGQHRVFCYHEGQDVWEKQIARLRVRQNLLVTGLIFPSSWNESQKREFEARLFLEINDNQAKAKSALKQTIELILNPFSTTAIAKQITNQLSVKGPLADMLQVSFFDPPEKIKTTSIVSYGLRPLIKLDGQDSLFATWTEPSKSLLVDSETSVRERRVLLDAYVKYCVDSINTFLIAAKLTSGAEKWRLVEHKREQFLTPTVLNGFFVCLRRLAERNQLMSRERYEKKLQDLNSFAFRKYKSSSWRAMGDKLHEQFFSS